MNVWFLGDTHFGHINIAKFRKEVVSEEDNRNWIAKHWKENVTKRDIVWVLGDSAFTQAGLDFFKTLPGEKRLVRGNHDNLPTDEYLKVFTTVEGLVRYKEFWLSHAPIHPLELRGKFSLHGHVHYSTIPDDRYLNCSCENLFALKKRPLISLQEVRDEFTKRGLNYGRQVVVI
jgi:calcineurin-like phosphoesterase family protein